MADTAGEKNSGRFLQLRPTTTASWKATRRRAHSANETIYTRPEIDYSQLKELCTRFTPRERIDHEAFMKEYPSIFKSQATPRPAVTFFSRPHTCLGTSSSWRSSGSVRSESTPPFDIRPILQRIHGRTKEEQKHHELSTSLKVVLGIVKKLPIERSRQEVKTLAEQLKQFFPHLTYDQGIAVDDFFTGLAKRAILELIPSAGYALPEKGGLYLLLKGRVEKMTIDLENQEHYTIIHPGCTFGICKNKSTSTTTLGGASSIKEDTPLVSYTSKEHAILLRVNGADYDRVIQGCIKDCTEERQKLINSCTMLFAVSPSILNRLAEDIVMDTFGPNTTLVEEGQVIDKVHFIQEGTCIASVSVPGSKETIVVGKLGPGDCIGEVFLHKGTETHPYTITTATRTKLGTVTCSQLIATDVEKHILSDRVTTLPSLTKPQIRTLYVRKTMDQQWAGIKDYIIKEVTTERGIQFGTKKWKHTQSEPS